MQFAALGGTTSEGGARFKPADHEGRLLLIEPIAYRTDIPTESGPAEAVEATVVDLDSNEKYDNALLFGVALRNALRPVIGQKVLARLGKGPAKPGRSAPWVLTDAKDDSEAVKKVSDYFAGGLSSPAPATPAATTAGIDPQILALLQQQMGAKQV